MMFFWGSQQHHQRTGAPEKEHSQKDTAARYEVYRMRHRLAQRFFLLCPFGLCQDNGHGVGQTAANLQQEGGCRTGWRQWRLKPPH